MRPRPRDHHYSRRRPGRCRHWSARDDRQNISVTRGQRSYLDLADSRHRNEMKGHHLEKTLGARARNGSRISARLDLHDDGRQIGVHAVQRRPGNNLRFPVKNLAREEIRDNTPEAPPVSARGGLPRAASTPENSTATAASRRGAHRTKRHRRCQRSHFGPTAGRAPGRPFRAWLSNRTTPMRT